MLAWNNVAVELVVRLHARNPPNIFISYDQVGKVFGTIGSSFRLWCRKHEIHAEETETGYNLEHRPYVHTTQPALPEQEHAITTLPERQGSDHEGPIPSGPEPDVADHHGLDRADAPTN